MAWTTEMDKAMRDGAARHLSASQIACEIWDQTRVQVTRNAVIGYAHREGIPLNRKAVSAPMFSRPKQLMGPQRMRRNVVSKPLPNKAHRERARINFQLLQTPNPLTILKLDKGVCHWPMWRHEGQTPIAEMFYCGAGTEVDAVYCHDHHMRSLPGSEPREAQPSSSPYRS